MQHETAVKVAFFGIGAVLLVYAGVIILVVLVPILILAWLVDLWAKTQYNTALKEWRSRNSLEIVPQVSLEVREGDDGIPWVGWDAAIPHGCFLEIYRACEELGASVDRVREQGQLVLTTSKAMMESADDILYDTSAPDGTLYYVPVITGERRDERPCEYSSYSYKTKLKFISKVQRLEKRGHSAVLNRMPIVETALELPDHRTPIARQLDEILQAIQARKDEEQELNEAIQAIHDDDRFTDDEKAQAIAQLESGYEPR